MNSDLVVVKGEAEKKKDVDDVVWKLKSSLRVDHFKQFFVYFVLH